MHMGLSQYMVLLIVDPCKVFWWLSGSSTGLQPEQSFQKMWIIFGKLCILLKLSNDLRWWLIWQNYKQVTQISWSDASFLLKGFFFLAILAKYGNFNNFLANESFGCKPIRASKSHPETQNSSNIKWTIYCDMPNFKNSHQDSKWGHSNVITLYRLLITTLYI